MNSLNFPDTNVWLALVWERHVKFPVATAWFREHQNQRIYFCRNTQMALLRLLTNHSVMGDDVQTMAGAWEIYDECCVLGNIALLSEPAGIESRLRRFSLSNRISPKAWADCYLAAFAETCGLQMVTFDKGFRSLLTTCTILD